MRVCLISVELFAWGKHGGFGRAARLIGRELAARGHEVFAVVPRRAGQQPVERLDGMTVLGFSPYQPWSAAALLTGCAADIYHSCEPSLSTYLAMRSLPDRAHVITVRDPRDFKDWRMEFARPSLNRWQVVHNYLYENSPWVRRAVARADAVCATARCLIPKVRRLYRLADDPVFLPTPVQIPAPAPKALRPTVCYLARLDRRKRPELFCELAERFPHARFIITGKSRDQAWEARLRSRYARLPNLEFAGFVDQFSGEAHHRILSESWVMVNTATREALPNAFLEAAAHGCAILSGVDPDGFASQFGYHAIREDFAEGLRWLLEGERWRRQGEQGYRYVRDTFELNRSMDQHLAVYERLLQRGSRSARAR